MMKIAILTSGILPVPAVQGGAVENLIDFCLEYNDKHHLHDITVYSMKHPKVKRHPALKSAVNHYRYIDTTSLLAKLRRILYLKKRGGNEYYHYAVEYFFEQAMKHLRRQSFDIIIMENRPGYALKLKGQVQAKLVVHQGNDFLNSNISRCQEIYDALTCIINASEYITSQVRTINPQDIKSRTVLNGIDTKCFYDAYPLPRNNMGIRDEEFVIVYSGRLTKEKGIMELVQAMSSLTSIPNWKLLIVGASAYGQDDHPTPFIEELIKVAEPIKDRIIFTGFIDYKQIPSYLKMADIAVVPSMWEEPFGLTVVEAMAAGLPLITTRSGGIPEICEGVATIVERNGIVDNLASAILDLYEHPEKRKQMSEASLERSKLFDKETYAQNFFQALEHIE